MASEIQRILWNRKSRLQRGRPPLTHSQSGYRNFGCRCEICVAAYREARTRYKKEPIRKHGLHAYKNLGCRCDVCRKAGADYRMLAKLEN